MRYKLELPEKRGGHNDAGDVINNEIQDVAIEPWLRRIGEPTPSYGAVNAIDDERHEKPENRINGFILKHRNKGGHTGQDACDGENVNSEIALGFSVVGTTRTHGMTVPLFV